jgi:hypothetical protein
VSPALLPPVTPFIPDDAASAPDERSLAFTARANDRDLVRLLRGYGGPVAANLLAGLPLANYDDVTIRDAWGTPIVFLPAGHRLVGMSSKGYFLFSAGPDRKFLTRDDNLYSYEAR